MPIKKKYAFIALVLNYISVTLIANGITSTDNRYPVFWNVNEATTPAVNITQYDILPSNYTQVGKSCSTPNCEHWTQGAFPEFLKNGSMFNGGVPQNANLTLHLNIIKQTLPKWIPDPDWNGNAVLDFEAWTTVWDYNYNPSNDNWHSVQYQNYSIVLAQQQYPNYNSSQIYAIAKKQFEDAATNFFVQTLKLCSSIRPKAKWGFYGFPLNLLGPCSGIGAEMQCGYSNPRDGAKYRNYSDQQIPIWKASGAIYPSIYLDPGSSDYKRMAYVNDTVTESLRCAKNGGIEGNLVYPYIWQKYHNGTTLLSEQDLNISVKMPYNLGAQALVIYGDAKPTPSDPLWAYVTNVSGPIIYSVVETVNQCSKQFCSSHGKCESLTSNKCICDKGYTGHNCSKRSPLH